MSSTKAGLRAAKAALDAQKYEEAAKEARKVLEVDSKNYHANVFLGLALDKQDKNDEAEKVYNVAASIKPNDPLSWQGLITLYEKQARKKIDQYQSAALRLAEIYMGIDDKTKCQTVVDKFVGFAKQHGTPTQYKYALEMMLPKSTLFDYLEGRFPRPDYIYTKVVEIVEAEEEEKIKKMISERRTRIGATLGQVTIEVKREVLENSNLEELYGCIINWTNDDDLRRQYEEKVLQRAYDILTVLPMKYKEQKRSQVLKLAEGLVILKHAYDMAWKIVLEWKDVESLEELDPGLLWEYVDFFPNDGLGKVLLGYLGSEISPFPKPRPATLKEEEEEDRWSLSAEDRLFLMTEGVEESPNSAMAHRVMAEYYLYLEEYRSAIETAKKAKELVKLDSQLSGLDFENNLDAANIALATALIHYQSPRNHPEARLLFEAILARKPMHTSALIGIGLIYEEEEEYEKAAEFLERALERTPDVKVRAEGAWCKALDGDWNTGLLKLESCLQDMEGNDARTKALKSQSLYRIGVCLWNLYPSKAARKDRNGAYAKFLAALQADMTLAPAYTSLGIYYADYGKDKKRARKCFQKAFELSPSEVVSAERLARAFADEREWDLVEVVAQRVVDSGKTKAPPGSKKKGLSWPFAALGVCQLNNQEYAKSVVSFQSALRISPEDYHCWVGLGESYHNSGRYIAATRAFEYAQKLAGTTGLHADDAWFSRYMLANVRRELGDFEEAIAGYEDVLLAKSDEFGVAVALLQTHVESAWRNVELGFFGQAADSAIKAITVARDLVKHRHERFNLWKAVGDACCIISWVQASIEKFPLEDVKSILKFETTPEIYSQLADYDKTELSTLSGTGSDDPSSLLEYSLQAGILAQKRAIYVCSHDIYAQAVAWYNLGWTEYRAHTVLAEKDSGKPKKNTAQYLKASVRCFKRAIELESGNANFWNALAVVTSRLNPKIAQHAFIRSLYLDDKSSKTWTNLGTLYLLHNDYELANQAFTRAQSIDPDYTHAWLGQGILALLLGEAQEAQSLFTHAFEIADSSSMLCKQLYASSTFDNLLTQTSSQITSLLQPLFALNQLNSQRPSDQASSHLLALLSERVGSNTAATETLRTVCAHLEVDYELSESPALLARFAHAKADLGRALLAEKDFPAAIEAAELALDLSADQPESETYQKYRLSAHLTAGLAYFYTNKMDQAISMFRTALSETDSSPDAICLLAQVLWAKGGHDERTVAREQLFECVETHEGHIGAKILLAVIAALDNDMDTMEAVASDLHDLRTHSDVSPQEQQCIARLLSTLAIANPEPGGADLSVFRQTTTSVMLHPSEPYGWSQLSMISEEGFPGDMALLTAMGAVPPKGEMEAEDLAKALAGTGRLSDAQSAVMVAPWTRAGWEGLAESLGGGDGHG